MESLAIVDHRNTIVTITSTNKISKIIKTKQSKIKLEIETKIKIQNH